MIYKSVLDFSIAADNHIFNFFIGINNLFRYFFVCCCKFTHRLQEIAPEAYRKYRNYAVNTLSEQAGSSAELVERYKSRYAASGVNLTTEEAMDEIAADFTEALTVDPSRFEALARDDRSVARKVLDAVRDFIRKVKRAISGRNQQNQAARETFGVDLDTLEQAARLWEDALRAGRETALQAGARDGRMGTTRNSLKEDGDHGRTREETREEFRRRCLEEGYQFLEKAGVGYGFRRAGQPDDGGTGEQTSRGAQTQQEMTLLGIPADVIDGPVLRNRNGITDMREVEQAVTVARSHVFISKDTTLSPRNIAGHEAFHLWKSGTGRDTYIETLEDNLLFSSEAFREYQSDIALTIFGQEADLTSPENTDKLFEELFAYISGDIHEGTNEDALRPMFRDFDAVRAAWEQLVEENRGGTRSSLKSDSEALEELRSENDRLNRRIQELSRQVANLKRDIQGTVTSAAIETDDYWNMSGVGACVHAFIGRLADGSIASYQTLPWNWRGWHCGSGRSGSANNTHISFEICEDGLDDREYFDAVYREAVELTAHLCELYGLDPLEDGVVICHSAGYRRGVASNHGDVMHWFPKFRKNMDGFRADVSRELKGDEDDMTQEQFNQMMTEYERTKNPVPDNTPADWEAPAVQWARDNGLLAGDGAGNLMLHSNMTRAQFFVILKKYHDHRKEIS